MQHPTLFFDDGDIVLSANTPIGEPWRFRVHRLTLSTHSPVFARILNERSQVEQVDTDGIQAVDNVRSLKISEPAVDLAALLQCLYYPNDMPFKLEEPTVKVDLAGLLRLCKKYDFVQLVSQVVDQLKYEWPTSLALYEVHESRVREMGIAHAAAPQGLIDRKYLDDRLPEPASIIRLSHEFNIPELLPAALYALALISPTADYDTFHSRAARMSPELAGKLARLTRSARWSLLIPADLRALAIGRDQLRSSRALTRVFEARPHGATCASGCAALLAALRSLADDTHDILGALTYLRLYISEPERAPKLKICAQCAAVTCRTIAVLRLRIWTSLPLWFKVAGVKCTE
ncbi:hypothetical protein B0H15DRAFT_269397 [Mycena belliarum]|uniref:BTB domain-containing protein n=1 Tax=Mycena belliarum TaxID=1033014 RepID=A0AAD6U571_9AGAR|nr:hypothetical protein B0H15DRAFT_269397 [Mycena belliae]